MALDLWGVIGNVSDKIEIFFTSGWDATKILQAAAALVSIATAVYGIYKAVRFAETRLSKRLVEYLQREEERLISARKAIVSALANPTPVRPHTETIYSNRALNSALRHMKWGRKDLAERSLRDALRLIDDKVDTALQLRKSQERQKAAAYLPLGAIADSNALHAEALAHFQAALDINPEDVEALEYAGLQLLKNTNPQQALQYFKELESKARASQNKLLIARSIHMQAQALCEFKPPQYAGANSLLLPIVAAFPITMSQMDRARINEFHGFVRRKAGYRIALVSYQNAANIYAVEKGGGGPNAKEADKALQRVAQIIAEINQEVGGTLGDELAGSQPLTQPVQA